MSQSSNLFRLQQIDTQLDQARTRLNQIELILSDKSTIQVVEENLNTAQLELEHRKQALRQAEIQAKDHKIKIELNETSLYSGKVRNPKELQDIQNEVAALKRYLVVLEDRELELMLSQEEAENLYHAAQQNRDIVIGKLIEEHAQLVAQQSNLNQTMENLNIERQVVEAAIPGQDMEMYLHLRKIRNGIAVSKIVDRNCGACGVSLPPALIQSASSPAQLARCTSCNRILYAG